MALTIDLPVDLERRLRDQTPDLDAQMRKAVGLTLFREGKISHYELSQILGLDRYETDAWLKRHGVYEGSLTMEDLDEQSATLARVMGRVRR